MKAAVVFIIAFVAAAAAGTGAKVAMTQPLPPVKEGADSTAVDSTHREGAEGKSGDVATKDSVVKPAPAATADTSKPTPTAAPSVKAASAKKEGAPAAAPAALAVVRDPADSATQASERRLAKVFTAMDAKQAAKVLEHMDDADVQILLGYVGPRQAASILAELPPKRVATLSKLAMQPPPTAGGKK